MSPPGKNSGDTTYESVVKASRPVPTESTAASSSASSVGLRNASTNSPSTRLCVAFPPAPCARVIRLSRIFGARRRARSMRFSTCCSGDNGPGSRSVVASASATARSAHSAVRSVVILAPPPSTAAG